MKTCVALIVLLGFNAVAAEWFVATNGTSGGDGSQSQPWDIITALKDNSISTNANHLVSPGDTIWIRSGRYGTGGSNLFTSKLVGTQANPITVRQYPGETAVVDGGIEVTGTWNRLWGFEIMNSLTNRTTTGAERVPGLNMLGEGSTAINLVIHDTGHPGIGFWKTCGDGAEIYGCLIWGTGTYQTDEGWNGRARGSGIYTQNTDGDRYISDVISFKNFTDGIKAFTINAEINGYSIIGNIVFQNNEDGIFVSAGNIPAERMDLGFNYAYNNYVSYLGYVYYPQIDLKFRDNYFVSEYNNTASFGIWQSLTVTNNTFVTATRTNFDNGAQSPIISLHLPTTNVLDVLLVGNNRYFGGGTNLSPFRTVENGVVSFAEWQTLTGDSNSAFTSSFPTTNVWALRTNKYEPGRSHLVVFNWENTSNIVVDLSNTGLGDGRAFEVRDVQNYFGDPAVSGRFSVSSPSVSIPINLTNCSVILGSTTNFQHDPNIHTSPLFNAFVILPLSQSAGSATANAATVGRIAVR